MPAAWRRPSFPGKSSELGLTQQLLPAYPHSATHTPKVTFPMTHHGSLCTSFIIKYISSFLFFK